MFEINQKVFFPVSGVKGTITQLRYDVDSDGNPTEIATVQTEDYYGSISTNTAFLRALTAKNQN